MQAVTDLIRSIRRITNQESYSTTKGMVDEEIIDYLNDAQDRIQSLINVSKSVSRPFAQQVILPIVSGQEEYTVDARLYFNKEVQQVEYTNDTTVTSSSQWVVLEKRHYINRDTYPTSEPVAYYAKNGKICLIGVPNSATGNLRVIYERTAEDLDKPRGVITVVGGSFPGYTSITLDSTADETSSPNLTTPVKYICVVSSVDGTAKARNVPVASYNPGTNVITISGGYSALTGETISIGDTITFGKYSTTHTTVPDDIDVYLKNYAILAIYNRDGVKGGISGPQAARVSQLERSLPDVYKSQTPEIAYIPQANMDEWF